MYEVFVTKRENSKYILLTENGILLEKYQESENNERLEGNIYLGKVQNVFQGMQAAFVNIGQDKNTFIHLKDILPQIDIKNGIKKQQEKVNIKDLIKPGMPILVQVKKDNTNKKGAKVSTHISLSSKYIVLLPNTTIVTISQKIEENSEKKRLEKEEYNQQMAQQQAQLQSLQAKVGDDTVVAPTDGRIIKLSCNIGDTVREYQTIMTLADENTFMLTGQEYSNSALKGASRLAVIIEGQEYPVTYVPYDDEEYVRLKMEDQNTPTRFLFQGEAPVSFGQSGTVLVYRAYSEDTLVVPKACVQSDELGSFVNVIKEDGSREKTYVSVGIQTDAFIEITEGLEEGDVVYANE